MVATKLVRQSSYTALNANDFDEDDVDDQSDSRVLIVPAAHLGPHTENLEPMTGRRLTTSVFVCPTKKWFFSRFNQMFLLNWMFNVKSTI